MKYYAVIDTIIIVSVFANIFLVRKEKRAKSL